MRFTPITMPLGELSDALFALPTPADERKKLGREYARLIATELYLFETYDDTTPAVLAGAVTRSKGCLSECVELLDEEDPAVRIVREMIALAAGELPPPRPSWSMPAGERAEAHDDLGDGLDDDSADEDDDVDDDLEDELDDDLDDGEQDHEDEVDDDDDEGDDEEVGDIDEEGDVAADRPAIACQFPGDFRPLLHADLRQIAGATWGQRHTTDWLLLQCAEKLLAHVRKLPPDRAWGVYAALAEKLNLDPDEAAARAACSPALHPPAADALARAYVGRASDLHSYVAGTVIADEILPHLGLSRIDASGAMLHTVQKFADLDLHAVAEFILAGRGDMRDYRRARGGRQCRRCGDYSYPGERHCRRCGPDVRRPILLTLLVVVAAIVLAGPPLLWLCMSR